VPLSGEFGGYFEDTGNEDEKPLNRLRGNMSSLRKGRETLGSLVHERRDR
jgi:hypothetical protein